MKLLAAVLTSTALLAATPRPARSCGAFIPSEVATNTAIAAQRALIVLRADTIELHLQPHAASDGTDFAWIFPVPSTPTLSLGDDAVFAALDGLTTPRVEITTGEGGDGGGIGCGSAADAKSGGNNFGEGVQHFGGGTLGNYQYDTISGETAEAIEGWLSDNGYVVPEGFAAAITPYVGKPFVAVKLAAGGEGETDLEPLVVSFPRPFDNSLGYALGLSRLSTTDVAPVLLWVLADKRYRIANYANAELQVVADVMREQVDRGEGADYAKAIDTLTAEASGRFVVTEFARELHAASVAPELAALMDEDAHYLTRVYMQVPKAEIEDLVVTFAANAPDVEPNATAAAEGQSPATAACIGLALLALTINRRRR